MQHEVMECDILIIGAGAAGLSASIRLAQLASENGQSLNIMVLEKGASVGAHILSGCVFEPRALDELLPNWKEQGAPLDVPVRSESLRWLGKKGGMRLPALGVMKNHGNYIISLGRLCEWLAQQAEGLGVQIMPGFPIAEPWIEDGVLHGGITGAFGLDKDGKPGEGYQPPLAIKAKYTLISEGCRGSIAEQVMDAFELRANCQPQTYGLGIKEIWQLDAAKHRLGHVDHHIGWPLPPNVYGGGFAYHAANQQLYLGMVAGLDYTDPKFSPYQAFQAYKRHPHIAKLLEGAKRISYGARALNEGGLQSLPKLSFAGGALIGCSAGFLNVPKIKGSHTAMKSGMLAAEAAYEALAAGRARDTLAAYDENVKKSWIYAELKAARNIRPAFAWGRALGVCYSGLDMLLGGRLPWTLKHHAADHLTFSHATTSRVVSTSLRGVKRRGNPGPARPVTPEVGSPRCARDDAPLGKTSNLSRKEEWGIADDIPSSLYLSGTNHREDQPSHLHLKEPERAISINWQQYGSPEQHYCPAGVYEITEQHGEPRLLIHAQNCLHCKTCDIKDPTQNIQWRTPEGGGGPNYQGM